MMTQKIILLLLLHRLRASTRLLIQKILLVPQLQKNVTQLTNFSATSMDTGGCTTTLDKENSIFTFILLTP